MRPRIYIDTSVFGGCHEEEFSRWSNHLMDEIRKGLKVAIVSDLTRAELLSAPEKVRKSFESLPDEHIELVYLESESADLARRYIQENVVGPKHMADAQHIAIATVKRADLLVSWNFKEIVNVKKIHAFNAVNLKLGYPTLEIRSPREVINNEEKDV